MASMRFGTIGHMKTLPVIYNGIHLGDLKIIERADWTHKDREPTPLDFELTQTTLCARTMYEIVELHPKRPLGPDEDEPWILTICKAVCSTHEDGKSREAEESVFRQYIDRYGMGQIISMFGGDPARIGEQLEKFKRDQDG